ncbi:hypothetical protein [Brevundimonas aurantiaca]|uniref:hypothetical protein n=1 Tax=Brevundimonas aurantiaca TaxID=74316 RepID=UPI001D183225|nr:hypothetical protein [Brevundimonas aurantiaca]MCC4294312.1 hypothetical protein [Brevundimonas aurantiaca]
MNIQHHDFAVTAGLPVQPTAIIDQLETARALIESRFSDAGGRLAGSLEMVGRLIESLDRLEVTLDAKSVSDTTQDLLSTAEGLNALPEAQRDRIAYFANIKVAGAQLQANIESMRTTLRYLRAFALNVKITAGSTIRASDEFAGFAERMCSQLDLGVGQLDELADQLTDLSTRLQQALEFEQTLSGKYAALIPAVPDRLAVDARAIQEQHTQIADVARSIAAIARDIQTKVSKALMALQIGDITRQRIEHVQLGLRVASRLAAQSDLAEEARDRAERRLLHMLAAQMSDIAADFEAEAVKVTQSLNGMAADTAQILAVNALGGRGGKGGLRELEESLGHAGLLVGDVTAAMANAHRISNETVSAVEALSRRVGAIQGVKRDIQQMAINSSLRSNRLGDIGKPLSVIAIELSSHAGQLEEEADLTLSSLNALAGVANDRQAGGDQDGRVDAGRLNGVRSRLRQAADVVEHDLSGLSDQGAATARSLTVAAEQLGLKADMGDALHAAAAALVEAAGPEVDDLSQIEAALDEAMNEIGRCYTMARERLIHAEYAVPKDAAPEGEEAQAETAAVEAAPAEADEFADLLF